MQWKRISSGRPFVIKGIQSVEDALKAHAVGCEGIVVTNHAGRQVDGAVGSLEVLPEIVHAVGDSEYSSPHTPLSLFHDHVPIRISLTYTGRLFYFILFYFTRLGSRAAVQR